MALAMRDSMQDLGFHLQVPLCNRCIHRMQRLLDDPTSPLECRILGEIPPPLLSCGQDDCEDFEEDEGQARLFEGLL